MIPHLLISYPVEWSGVELLCMYMGYLLAWVA